MKKKPIYVLHHKLLWRNFKALSDKLPKGSIVPMGIDKVLWKMLKSKQIFLWLDPLNKEGDLSIGLELPKNREIKLVTNRNK